MRFFKETMRFLLPLLLLTFSVLAQDRKTESYMEKGEELFRSRDYGQAKIYFDRALQRNSELHLAFFRMGQMYAAEGNSTQASKYYLRAIEIMPDERNYLPAYTYLATQLLNQRKYENAKVLLTKALGWAGEGTHLFKQLNRQLATCDFAVLSIREAVKIQPTLISEKLNFKQKQYFPVLTADEQQIFFTARDENGDEDILMAIKSEKGEWEAPQAITTVNTPFNEGTCSISADGHVLVFTSCEGRRSFGSCDLFMSTWDGTAWSEPQNLGENVNSRYWESQPSLSTDGSTLYFSSDRPGGSGRKDIYKSVWQEALGWSKAENLGSVINTEGDEVSPFLHANSSSLFFASNYHVGLGGFDLFIAQDQDSTFTEPLNLGYPINTELDQLAFFISPTGKKAYYSVDDRDSVRLFQVQVPEKIVKLINPVMYVKGEIKDSISNRGLGGELSLIQLATGETVAKFSAEKETGKFMATVPAAGKYALYISNPGYFFRRYDFEVDVAGLVNIEKLVVHLKEIQKNKPETLRHIFFDTGSAVLKPESKVELNKLIQVAQDNPSLHLAIEGHTDDVGTEESNLLLSQQRAQSVVNYLSEKIDGSRLIAKGLGEAEPIMPNNSEENRALNRRIEVRFL